MIYLLDTNVISDLIISHPEVTHQVQAQLLARNQLGIIQPIYYELLRGLLWRNATSKQATLERKILPQLHLFELVDGDWKQAASYWAASVKAGRQFSDVDLLLAAVAFRLDATLVTSDDDFNSLSIKRANWRMPPQSP